MNFVCYNLFLKVCSQYFVPSIVNKKEVQYSLISFKFFFFPPMQSSPILWLLLKDVMFIVLEW